MLSQQLKGIGLSDEEINTYLNSDESVIYLQNGEVVDNEGNPISLQRGKFSWAAAAIRKKYSKLPKSVKNIINSFTNIEVILGLIQHFTGMVEDALYKACKYVGMPDWAAWTVSKGLTVLF